MEWYLKVMRDNYANFTGRARRKEYWMFALFQAIIMIVLVILDNVLGLGFDIGGIPLGYGVLYTIGALAHFIPGLAVNVRRLHDVGKSGWFYLIVLIPLIGIIWLLVLMCTDGDKGDNAYGPDPKA
tara:strand:+ start:213 stop:590 length:378 start_codon:yes stop_codon:yes gene_type:complete